MSGLGQRLLDELRNAVVNGPLASPLVPRPVRRSILRWLGYDVDPGACIAERCFIGSRQVSFAAGSFVNVGCFFDGNASIRIGQGVQIGMHSVFVTASHEISAERGRRAGRNTAAPIVVGDGVWVGARSTILPGVSIGEGTVVGAGSLVLNACAPDSVYVGAPARMLRPLLPTPDELIALPRHGHAAPTS